MKIFTGVVKHILIKQIIVKTIILKNFFKYQQYFKDYKFFKVHDEYNLCKLNDYIQFFYGNKF